MALRVDHASNTAAPCPTAINAYQSFCCRGVGTGRSIADLMGAFEKGWMEVSPGSLEASALATGTSGSPAFEGAASRVLTAAFGVAAESLTVVFGESEAGNQSNSSAADRTTGHLRGCRPGRMGPVRCNADHYTVPGNRCHWPVGHKFD